MCTTLFLLAIDVYASIRIFHRFRRFECRDAASDDDEEGFFLPAHFNILFASNEVKIERSNDEPFNKLERNEESVPIHLHDNRG